MAARVTVMRVHEFGIVLCIYFKHLAGIFNS